MSPMRCCSWPRTMPPISPAPPSSWMAARRCPKAPTSASIRAETMAGGRLQDRVALVTGAARGIGLAAARALAREGARVLICDIDAAALDSALVELQGDGFQVKSAIVDVADHASIARAVDAAAGWGRLDILVSNAAITDDTPFDSLSP